MIKVGGISAVREQAGKTKLASFAVLVFILALSASLIAQDKPAHPSGSSPEATQHQPATDQIKKKDDGQVHFGAVLAKDTREAAGEDETAEFKQSASVQFLARVTGLSLLHAYWLAVLINFAVIAGGLFWVARKFLPGMFRDRTTAIQKAMEEARKASAEANRRLSEIEDRLSRLDAEIREMQAAAEKEAEGEYARILAATEEDKRKIIESAEQEITAAGKQARRELAAHAADLAVALAQKQIRVDPATDQTLVRSFADSIASGGPKKGTN
jgi:F-type H+-transporting ATPase subunit b